MLKLSKVQQIIFELDTSQILLEIPHQLDIRIFHCI